MTIERRGDDRGRVRQSEISVCLRRRGLRRVVARGLIVDSPTRRARGRFYSDAAASSRELAYAAIIVGRRRTDEAVVTVLSRRTLRVLRRIRFLREYELRYFSPEVAIADDGSVALGFQEDRLFLARRGAPPGIVNAGFLDALRFEDGMTLAWNTFYGEEIRYVDLATPPLRDGCPVRSAFREQVRTDQVMVSQSGNAVRVCDRGTGGDPVVAAYDLGSESSWRNVSVVGAAGALGVVGIALGQKGQGCTYNVVRVLAAGTGGAVRETKPGPCGLVPPDYYPAPPRPVPIVVAPSGAPAWIVTHGVDSYGRRPADRVAAVDGDELRQLDEGPGGSITDLRATTDGIAWRSGGVEKTATLR